MPWRCQQVVGEQPGARAGLALHKAQRPHGQVRQLAQRQRVALGHHQALGAAHAADQLVAAGLEQRLQALWQRPARLR